jgi:hypothetical protein
VNRQFPDRSATSSPQKEDSRAKNQEAASSNAASSAADGQRAKGIESSMHRQRWLRFLARHIAADILRAQAAREGGFQ